MDKTINYYFWDKTYNPVEYFKYDLDLEMI